MTAAVERDLPPTPIALQSGQQSVHLRFLIGTALAAPGVDLLSGSDVAGWAMPFARELARQLAVPQVSVLALPRAPQRPLAALQQGRSAQREVGAQQPRRVGEAASAEADRPLAVLPGEVLGQGRDATCSETVP